MKDAILKFFSTIYPYLLLQRIRDYNYKVLSFVHSTKFIRCGKGTRLWNVENIIGHNLISIGENNTFLPHLIMTAWNVDEIIGRKPRIIIGNNCSIGAYCHISSANRISIGNDVLIGKWVSIIDNDHGATNKDNMIVAPYSRKLYSKGPIEIGSKVWIGDKVTVLGGVAIGDGAVIAANAVVTKNIPPYSVAAGIPAKIIKSL